MQLRTKAWKVVVLALLVPAMPLVSATSGLAQDGPRATEPHALPPAGSAVQPRAPVPQTSPPEDRQGGSRTEPETRLQPRYDQPHGGCRYRERTLELIV